MVRVVDRVVENSEFALGIRLVKAACVAAGIERGKKMVRVWSASSIPGSSDPVVVARSVDPMHAVVKAFSEMDSASYLRLGELDLADLHQLCFEEEEELVSDGGVEGVSPNQPR
ncbi:unnamed protein product [Lactuca saligna]|uniref:Uncharacterized protein n=1 Tax=Lactuca saligna TaxID=75948 RepID=A0AA36E4Z6_LACSI|nr:unnamed protein product [Lactuca saligna]